MTQAYSEGSEGYLVNEWSYQPNSFINKVLVDDLNGDGILEIIASGRDGTVYDLGEDAKDRINWQTPMGGDIKALKLVDYDRDGKNEVLAGADKTGISIRLLDFQGINKGSTIDFEQRVNALDAADIDGDGAMDVVVGTNGKKVYVLKSGETVLWEYAVKGTVYDLHSADLEGDGGIETVAASIWSDNGEGNANIYALDSQGRAKWIYSVAGGIPTSSMDPLEVADIDGDGMMETIAGTSAGGVVVLGSDGRLLWDYTTEKLVNVVYVADFDGKKDILVGATPYVYSLSMYGKLLWKFPVSTTVFSLHVADADSDGISDVIVGANKYIHVVSGKGKLLGSWNGGMAIRGMGQEIETKNLYARSIDSADIDGDGKNEVIVGFGWPEDMLDSTYYYGDVRVFEVNESYVAPESSLSEPDTTVQTTSTKKRTTTTSKEVKQEPEAATNATIGGIVTAPASGNEETGMALLAGVLVVVLLILIVIVFVFTMGKRPGTKEKSAQENKKTQTNQ